MAKSTITKDISEMTIKFAENHAEEFEAMTMLNLKIMNEQGENHTMLNIDPDIFLLALILQIIRQCCNKKEHCD
jgi:hypothetical protein